MIVLVCVFSMFFTSCGNIYQDAYMAELYYRDAVEHNYPSRIEYQQEFLDIWHSMTDYERETYRKYRSKQEKEIQKTKQIENEALELLNE